MIYQLEGQGGGKIDYDSEEERRENGKWRKGKLSWPPMCHRRGGGVVLEGCVIFFFF